MVRPALLAPVENVDEHAARSLSGAPASTLTDTGRVYTVRPGGVRNEFEYVLAALNIRQNNGAPNHPQTQGKIERFHQTLKRWLAARSRAYTRSELQTQLDTFRDRYNTARPHRARDGLTPATAAAAAATMEPARHGNVAATLYALIPGFLGASVLVDVGLGLCNQAGKGIWVYWTWAGHVWCTGP